MTLYAALVPLPVILPLLGAGIALANSRRQRVQRIISIVVLSTTLTSAGVLLYAADRLGPQVVRVGGWPPTEGITLIVDRLAALMLMVSAGVTLAVLLYSIGQGVSSFDNEQDGQSPLPIFHPSLLVLTAGVSTTFISGDLFHIYVGFEMLLFASFVLLTLGGTSDRVRAGIAYAFVSIMSSMCFLIALALIYASAGTVNLALLAGRLDSLPDETRLMLQVLLLVGFAIKAAVFPMNAWLPQSYPTAPAPVTAVFAGLLTKVGVYAMIRTQTLLFPDEMLTDLLLGLALLTMIVGILGAIVQDDIKRMLSYTLVSHIGYLVMGIALASTPGLAAAIFYAAHHITIQTTLFLVVGLVERAAGSTSVTRLGGLARTAPMLAVLFFVPALNLAGIPPFSGFVGKVGLLQAATERHAALPYVLIAGAVLTSLLTLYAVCRVWARAFWREPVVEVDEPMRVGRHDALSWGVVTPTAALVLVGIGYTVVAGPMLDITSRTANDLLARHPYITAVVSGDLGHGTPPDATAVGSPGVADTGGPP